jgi:hypothetical protein
MVNPIVWLLRPLFAPQRDLRESSVDLIRVRFLAWRRSLLVLVLIVTALTAAIDIATNIAREPQLSRTIVLRLELESEPAQQTFFGDAADFVWLLSFYAMPASALLAAVFWARQRMSASILLAGWIASFLVPVAIALTPWSWWTTQPPPATVEGGLVHQYTRITAGLGWAYYYIIMLSPAVLALVPGVIRACVRVKMLLPEAILPGWLMVAAAPFNGLLVLVTFVALAQVTPSTLLLAGMVLWLTAPLVYLARARVYTRPITSPDQLQRAWRIQALAWILALGSAACLITYTATWQVSGLRLVGLDPKSSLLRPWHIVHYFLDFSGRAMFVTVLGADLLLRATLSAWRHERVFIAMPQAEKYDRLMAMLEQKIIMPTATGSSRP